MRRARDGDERAFEEIVRRYRAPLIRYSARHVGRDNAEDITQHALASAANHLREDPRPIHLRAWLYRVAHNAAINMAQRKDFSHEELSHEIDGVPQPPDIAAQRTEVREVVSELDRLPDRQRTALLLSVFEGLGYDEIAARLDTSPNSVRALLSRARGHLRKAAAALAPLPLLEAALKKLSTLGGASTGSQGTIAAGGSIVQAKLVAVAATTVVVGGAATAERAASNNDPAPTSPAAAAAPLEADAHHAVPVAATHLLPSASVAAPAKQTPDPKPAAAPPEPAAPQPLVEPPPVEPAPVEPVAEEPVPAPVPPAAEEPAAEEPADEAPKEGEEATDTFESEDEPSGIPPGDNPPASEGGYTQP